uniref:Rhodanese domain-containing protein n=1 Tax=Lotharella globosa TaxID=91324 RepID=A0A7S3YKC3_9EUKA|mmetsp:Transcript_1413/g.2693  ORF Transcript_1413/g.2693 Transcript_1413/m.2693 type:complete len:706 (+) Transcript_1413:230-2347(+)
MFPPLLPIKSASRRSLVANGIAISGLTLLFAVTFLTITWTMYVPSLRGPSPSAATAASSYFSPPALRFQASRAYPTNFVGFAGPQQHHGGRLGGRSVRDIGLQVVRSTVERENMKAAVDGFNDVVSSSVRAEEVPVLSLRGYKILDVRAQTEVQGYHPLRSISVPYVTDNERRELQGKSLKSKWVKALETGGRREEFLSRVKGALRLKDVPVIVACSDGLVSMAATKALHDAGYTKARWLKGGLASAPDGMIASEGPAGSYGLDVAGKLVGAAETTGQAVLYAKDVATPYAAEASSQALSALQNNAEAYEEIARKAIDAVGGHAPEIRGKLDEALKALKEKGPRYQEKTTELLATVQKHAPEVQDKVTQALNSARAAADHPEEASKQAWATLKEKAPEVVKALKDNAPAAQKRAQQALEKIQEKAPEMRDAVSAALETLKEHEPEYREKTRQLASALDDFKHKSELDYFEERSKESIAEAIDTLKEKAHVREAMEALDKVNTPELQKAVGTVANALRHMMEDVGGMAGLKLKTHFDPFADVRDSVTDAERSERDQRAARAAAAEKQKKINNRRDDDDDDQSPPPGTTKRPRPSQSTNAYHPAKASPFPHPPPPAANFRGGARQSKPNFRRKTPAARASMESAGLRERAIVANHDNSNPGSSSPKPSFLKRAVMWLFAPLLFVAASFWHFFKGNGSSSATPSYSRI